MCGRHRGNREGRRVSMRQYEIFELSLSGEQPSGSYVAVDLSAEFVHRQFLHGKRKAHALFYGFSFWYRLSIVDYKSRSVVTIPNDSSFAFSIFIW